VARNFLLFGSRLRGGERLGMGWEGLGEHAVDLICQPPSCSTIS
jgi:hypothetical protein